MANKVSKGLYQSIADEKLIVFVFDNVDGRVIYTEALHPVVKHCVLEDSFLEQFKKVHKVAFAESE